jgi:uncharacterized caspase-like protein
MIISVIGIDDYQIPWSKLENAVKDAQGIQRILTEKYGFIAPVDPLINAGATKQNILALVEDQLRNELAEDDSLVLFFAGHGHSREDKVGEKKIKTGYLVPAEAKESWSDYLELDPLLQAVSKLPARHILVILDSCHSGFALGDAMKTYRSAMRYEQDLGSRVSRTVITSARHNQLALDGGPVEGHSLFTGTLIDGLNWCKADLDGNNMITSTELGLYIQQQVGQSSKSRQTPDFGRFHYDDRGELIISLRNESFDALKGRAFSALQTGVAAAFKALADQVATLRPTSAEALYLKYRALLSDRNIDGALEMVSRLLRMDLRRGTIPLSKHDLEILSVQLPFWRQILSMPEGEFPVKITLLISKSGDSFDVAAERQIGDTRGYHIAVDHSMKFSMKNLGSDPLHVYAIEMDGDGRLGPITLWGQEDTMFNGLKPGITVLTHPFKQIGVSGLCRMLFYSSPQRIPYLLAPPAPGSRALISPFSIGADNKLKMKEIRYLCLIHEDTGRNRELEDRETNV